MYEFSPEIPRQPQPDPFSHEQEVRLLGFHEIGMDEVRVDSRGMFSVGASTCVLVAGINDKYGIGVLAHLSDDVIAKGSKPLQDLVDAALDIQVSRVVLGGASPIFVRSDKGSVDIEIPDRSLVLGTLQSAFEGSNIGLTTQWGEIATVSDVIVQPTHSTPEYRITMLQVPRL